MLLGLLLAHRQSLIARRKLQQEKIKSKLKEKVTEVVEGLDAEVVEEDLASINADIWN